MVARLKVNIYILFSLFFIHFSRAAPVTKSLIWKQKKNENNDKHSLEKWSQTNEFVSD